MQRLEIWQYPVAGGEEDDDDGDSDFNLCFICKSSHLKSNFILHSNGKDSNGSKLFYVHKYIQK